MTTPNAAAVYALCGIATALVRAIRHSHRPASAAYLVVIVLLWPLYVIGLATAAVLGFLTGVRQ